MEAPNYARLSEGLKIFRDRTLTFVESALKEAYGRLNWWELGVARHLTTQELDGLKDLMDKRGQKLSVLPSRASELHEMLSVNHFRPIVEGNWRDVFANIFTDRLIISWFQEITNARNAWAHPSSGEPEPADVNRVLDTCARITAFFDQEASRRLAELRDRGAPVANPPPRTSRPSVPMLRGQDMRGPIREVFERIIQRQADPKFELEGRTLTFTHFAPLSWDRIIPKSGTRPSRRILSFLMENRSVHLRLFLEICPGDQGIRRRIFDTVRRSSVFKPPNELSPQWCRVFRRDILKPSDYEGLTMTQIEQRIEDAFHDFVEGTFKDIDSVIRQLQFS